jgi:nucleoid-associated protein YgaU
VAHMEEGTVESGETIERVSSVTYDAQGNAVAASPEVLSSVSYDAQGNVMSAEQVAAAAQAEAEAKAAAEAAAAAAAKAEADAAAAAAAAPVERTYTVVKGDTLSAIGKKFGVNWRDIAALNHIKNPDLIHPGEVFRIPN